MLWPGRRLDQRGASREAQAVCKSPAAAGSSAHPGAGTQQVLLGVLLSPARDLLSVITSISKSAVPSSRCTECMCGCVCARVGEISSAHDLESHKSCWRKA